MRYRARSHARRATSVEALERRRLRAAEYSAAAVPAPSGEQSGYLKISRSGRVFQVGTSDSGSGNQTSYAVSDRGEQTRIAASTFTGGSTRIVAISDDGHYAVLRHDQQDDQRCYLWHDDVVTKLNGFSKALTGSATVDAAAVNDAGTVVGSALQAVTFADGRSATVSVAAKWKAGSTKPVALGSLIGKDYGRGHAVAINDAGAVVGTAQAADTGDDQGAAAAFSIGADGKMRALATTGVSEASVSGITRDGSILGTARKKVGSTRQSVVVVWAHGTVQVLAGSATGTVLNVSINNGGQVVADLSDANDVRQSLVWDTPAASPRPLASLLPSPYEAFFPSGIDDSGRVVGDGRQVVDGFISYDRVVLAPLVPFATLVNGTLAVNGTPGDDVLSVRQISGSIIAGRGAASLTFSVGGLTTIRVSGASGDDTIAIDQTVAQGVTLEGGDGNDRLTGTPFTDSLSGGAGKDTLVGGSGDDVLSGSGGNDAIYGGDGRDRLYGGAGNDLLFGEASLDRLDGGDGNDTLAGGSSSDRLYGGAGDDLLDGGNAGDALDGGAGSDTAPRDDADTRVAIEVLT